MQQCKQLPRGLYHVVDSSDSSDSLEVILTVNVDGSRPDSWPHDQHTPLFQATSRPLTHLRAFCLDDVTMATTGAEYGDDVGNAATPKYIEYRVKVCCGVC